MSENPYMDGATREFGHAGRMTASRRYLGLELPDMAEMLGVRWKTLQSWESGRDPIPVGIWKDLDTLFQRFDTEVEKLVTEVQGTNGDTVPITIWRTRKDELPPPAWWQRIVAEAMRREPRITPVFPN